MIGARARVALSLAYAASLSTASIAEAAPKIADPQGTPVTFTAKDQHTIIFLAHGDVPDGAPPIAYERIGEAPVEVRLAPGVYTVEADEPSSSLGHARFSVEQGKPLHIDVRNGNATVRAIGGTLTALGALSVLVGVVVAVSFGPHDESFNKWAIAIPLLAGGAGAASLGVGFVLGGATTVNMPTSAAQARGVSVQLRF